MFDCQSFARVSFYKVLNKTYQLSRIFVSMRIISYYLLSVLFILLAVNQGIQQVVYVVLSLVGLLGHLFGMDSSHHENNAKSKAKYVLLKCIIVCYKYIGLHFFPKVFTHKQFIFGFAFVKLNGRPAS